MKALAIVADITTIGRGIVWFEVAPSLERPTGPGLNRDKRSIERNPAFLGAVVDRYAVKTGNPLSHSEIAVNHPINRAARQHIGLATRIHPYHVPGRGFFHTFTPGPLHQVRLPRRKVIDAFRANAQFRDMTD